MSASVKLPELTVRQHSLVMDAIRTRIDYIKDELKLGDGTHHENRALKAEMVELNDLLERIG